MSVRRFLKRLEVPREDDAPTSAYMNKDTRPLPPSRRTYGPWHFIGLWVVTGSFNIGGWTTGSSLIALGLNVWQSMLTVIIGHCCVGAICVLAGMPGAKWHIGFSILQKSSWGMLGGYFPLINRILLSFIWYSTQVWWGGQCVKTFLTALWPSYSHLDTPLASGTMTTGDFTAFIIFSLLCMPLIMIRPERYKVPFGIAAITVIPTVFILLIYCVVKAKGGGALLRDVSSVAGIEQAKGSQLGWMFVLGVISNIGGISTHIFSQSDFTRFARKPRDQLLSQIIMVPLNTIVVSLIGIVCTSCAAQLYPSHKELLWAPYQLFSAIQENAHNSSGSRAAVAFASLSFIFAQFGIAVAENALSNGIDLSALAPRYFTLVRGGLLTALVAFIMQPWQLMNGASKFLTVMGGYAVFLSPMIGVMFADYYCIRKRKLKLTALYDCTPESIYWFTSGVNWRAPISFIMGVWLVLPGFVQRVRDPSKELAGWSKIYYLCWPVGCFVSMLTYIIADKLFPIQHAQDVDDQDYFGTFDEKVILDAQSSEQSSVKEEHVIISEKA